MVNKQKPTRRVRLGIDLRRARLLEVGRRLFGLYGYDQLSISDIAKAAKVSKGLLYHYFSNKRVFYVETQRAAASQLLQLSEGEEINEPHDQLRHSLETFLRYIELNSAAYIALFKSPIAADPEIVQIVDDVRQTFFKRILDVVQLEDPTVEQRLLLKGWIGFVEAISMEWLGQKTMEIKDLCELLERQLIFILTPVGLFGNFAENSMSNSIS